MQVTCPNPTCGAVYNVGPQHAGKSFPCRACGAIVSVGGGAASAPIAPTPIGGGVAVAYAPQGMESGVAPGAAAGSGTSSAAFASAAATGRVLQQKLTAQVKADLFTWLLGAGVIVLAFFLFMPLLDIAKVARRQAKIESGDLAQIRLDEDLQHRDKLAGEGKGTAPTADERKSRGTARDDWEQNKHDLVNEAKDADINAKSNGYWYLWGAFIGAMMVTIAAIGYVAKGETTVRRVTGAVLVCFLVITFLGAILGGKGPMITFHP